MDTVQYIRLDPQTLAPDEHGILYRQVHENDILKVNQAVNEFKFHLTVDKPTISADGTDTATITATILNYLDEPQTGDNSTDVVFELDGQQQVVRAENGTASITFRAEAPGTYRFAVYGVGDFLTGGIEVRAV